MVRRSHYEGLRQVGPADLQNVTAIPFKGETLRTCLLIFLPKRNSTVIWHV